jgi:hypothetical protein
VDLRKGRKEQLAMERWRPEFKRIQSETTVREKMGRTLWWLATEMMEKLRGDTDSRPQCAGDGFERVESNNWRGKIARGFRRIQSNYGQTEYGKNGLVVGDRGDGENPL